jgi:AraC-like DNA-binding protein
MPNDVVERKQIAPVATVLDPADRREVDRAGVGLYRTVHRETVADVLKDLRVRRLSAVLLSATRCQATELPRTMRVVREFPRVPAMVLLSRSGDPSPADILALGNCGVRRIVDVRTPAGWTRLREVLSANATLERDVNAAAELATDLQDMPADFVRFVEALFASYTGQRTVRELADALGVLPSTLMSRFYRARLPAPKRYLVLAGLVRAARLFENPGLSVADVANHLDHSSPQSFGRHIWTYLGISSGEFRKSYDGARMMARFREELIAPYRARLATLSTLVMRTRGVKARAVRH